MYIPRIRIFAGPNGSGKSTIKTIIPENLLGHYLNPDEIEKQVQNTSFFDLTPFQIQMYENEITNWFEKHDLSKKLNKSKDFVNNILANKNQTIQFQKDNFDSYMSAILVDFLRHKLLETKQSFTFETVMSSEDKVKLLKKAQALGYRTYLYYVATESPEINLLRVNHRVKNGGHNVPDEKIRERYYKSLELLKDAISHTNRAFIFDNSGETKVWIGEIIDAKQIRLEIEKIPYWFQKYFLEKLG